MEAFYRQFVLQRLLLFEQNVFLDIFSERSTATDEMCFNLAG